MAPDSTITNVSTVSGSTGVPKPNPIVMITTSEIKARLGYKIFEKYNGFIGVIDIT